jgi:hypothetical protein
MRLILSILRRPLVIAVVVVALLFGILVAATRPVALMFLPPRIGAIAETWETSNGAIRVRVDRRYEENGGFVPGAYYVFRSAPAGSDNWSDIMTFRHDDPVPIPRDQVRFVNARVGFVFMGWMYAVTTDGGASWSVWDSFRDLPKWQCCTYRLVKDVHLEPNGTGTMTISVIPDCCEAVPQSLHTKDYGRHWSV